MLYVRFFAIKELFVVEGITVETKLGKIRGTEEKGTFSFKGIPYAKPPIGDLRFVRTQPAEAWEGTLDAVEFGPNAYQNRNFKTPLSEDCLTLNIWTPNTNGKKAVMFFIHGGSFATGAGSDGEYNGANLAGNGDVVVVTVNYRLNVLGFMDFSFMGNGFDANCGLYDIVEALKFTHENIAAFGGDENNITVFGQSAGATCASVLAQTPEANRYISKIIMMSGGPTLLHKKEFYQGISKKYLEFTGIRTAEELKTLPPERIAMVHKEFASHCGLGAGAFMIEVDGELVREFPIIEAQKGNAKDMPILVGTTREEMSFFFIKPVAAILDIKGIMDSGVGVEREEVKQGIMDSYKRYGKKSGKIMLSDMVFRMGSMWYARAHSEHADAWIYRFDYATPAMKVSGLHAFHSSDVPFVFGNFKEGLGKYMFLFSLNKKKYIRIYREMQKDFYTFAKTGKLPWKNISGKDTTGKCYDMQSFIDSAVHPETMDAYEQSEFYKRSFFGGSDFL